MPIIYYFSKVRSIPRGRLTESLYHLPVPIDNCLLWFRKWKDLRRRWVGYVVDPVNAKVLYKASTTHSNVERRHLLDINCKNFAGL